MSLAERRSLRMFTLCVLYCAQGIPWGFTAITIPAYLAARGLSPAAVGATLAMTTIPYSFKWMWGPIIDALPSRRFGRRRPWIVLAQGMMALTIGAMIAIPDLTASVELLAWMIFVHTIFNSMQDVAVDALAIDLLAEAERGTANGLMYASKYGGGLLGGAGMSILIGHTGLRTALTAQTAVLLAIMLVPLLVRERDGDLPPRVKGPIVEWFATFRASDSVLFQIGRAIRDFVVRMLRDRSMRTALVGGGLVLSINLATGMLTAVAPVLFTQQLHWKDTAYVTLIGGPGLISGLVGSVLGGFLADKVGHRRLAAIAAAGLAIFWIVWAAAAAWWTNDTLVFALVIVEPLCASVMTVSLFALCMDISWPRMAASQFAIYMALLNLSTTFGFRLAGPVTAALTYRGVYIAAAVMQLAPLLLLPLVDPRVFKRAAA